MTIGDVIQFNAKHKWCGSLGIIKEVKICKDDVRYMIGVPIPQKGAAFIFVMASENAIEYIGQAVMTFKDEYEAVPK